MTPEPTTDEIRAAVMHRAVTITYTAVSTELAMSRANLNKFLHGSEPHASTLARMRLWYAQHYPPGTAPAPIADVFGRLSPDRVAKMRAAIDNRIVATSLRAAARAVGMSPSGLQKFLDGSPPGSITVEKLLRWYARETGNPFACGLPSGRAAGAAQHGVDIDRTA